MPIPEQPAASDQTARPAAPGPAAHGPEEFNPVAGLLGFIIPGAGHFYLGERSRALRIGAGVLGMFFGGMLIGGIDVVDRREDTIWFAGQALVGPIAFATDFIHQNHIKVIDPGTGERRTAYPEVRSAQGDLVRPTEVRGPAGIATPAAPGQPPTSRKSLGRMNELGTLFATIAGMLNLIAVIDAAFRQRRAP